jgi:hypothetical protein
MPFMESSIGGNSFATRLAKWVGVIDSLLNLNSLLKQMQKELKVQITMIDSNWQQFGDTWSWTFF